MAALTARPAACRGAPPLAGLHARPHRVASSSCQRFVLQGGGGLWPARLGASLPEPAVHRRRTAWSINAAAVPDLPESPSSEASPGSEDAEGRRQGSFGGVPKLSIQNFLTNLDVQRVSVWAFVMFLGFQMRDFYGIAMGTFIITFVGNSFVTSASAWTPFESLSQSSRRKLLVLTYFVCIALVMALFGVLTIPHIAAEGVDFVGRLESQTFYEVVLQKMRDGLGDSTFELLERFMLLATNGGEVLTASATTKGALLDTGREWTQARMDLLAASLAQSLKGYTQSAIQLTTALLTFVTKFAVQLGISLVLSFMMVWDYPSISQGVQSMKKSRLAAVYEEVAPSIVVFSRLFGKALQAQAMIAVCNTLLTAIGMWILGIPGIGLLSMFVFTCSFIPVLGCFISTVPIGFVALTEYGFYQLAMVILMVVAVHMVEAYGLNPAIYSAHLKLHPLLVLTVLVVAEHSMGVWGLLLGVPLTVFTLDYVIRYPADSVTDVAVRELDAVGGTVDEADLDAGEAITALYTRSRIEAEGSPS